MARPPQIWRSSPPHFPRGKSTSPIRLQWALRQARCLTCGRSRQRFLSVFRSNTQSGAITGTPSTVGTNFAYIYPGRFLNPSTNCGTTSLSLTIKPPLSITTTSLPSGNIGAVYGQPVQTVGGFEPLTFSINPSPGNLPPGFNLNANTGVISGTTTQIGSFSLHRPRCRHEWATGLESVHNCHQPIRARHRLRPLRYRPAQSISPIVSRCRQPLELAPLTWSIPVGSPAPGSHDRASPNWTQCNYFRHSNHSRNLQLHAEGHRHLGAVIRPCSLDYH